MKGLKAINKSTAFKGFEIIRYRDSRRKEAGCYEIYEVKGEGKERLMLAWFNCEGQRLAAVDSIKRALNPKPFDLS